MSKNKWPNVCFCIAWSLIFFAPDIREHLGISFKTLIWIAFIFFALSLRDLGTRCKELLDRFNTPKIHMETPTYIWPRIFFFIGWSLVFFCKDISDFLGVSTNVVMLTAFFFGLLSLKGLGSRWRVVWNFFNKLKI